MLSANRAVLATAGMLALCMPVASGERVTVSLDGEWQIEDGASAQELPQKFTHRVPVPGLANLAEPVFADVDRFDSRELIDNRIRRKVLPPSTPRPAVGIPRQTRNWFWYATSFRPPARRQVAILRVGKAQFGTAVWLNGRKIGEHLGCFTAGYFDLTSAIRWSGENWLVVRVGAHPAALPESVPAGTDFEKTKWTPGIYDSVSLLLADNPVIESVQVAPEIAASEILVQTRVRNPGAAPASVRLVQAVKTREGRPVAVAAPWEATLAAGEERTFTQAVRIPNATLWSPENPFLYVLETGTGSDSVSTRFGMREFHFDTATKRAVLNGRPYFLRGSNITLHRFFEDPKCRALPWDRKWVRKLLAEIPKRMHWNAFRFCIGPVPDFWLDIADEAGLLIQNEFFIWTGRNGFHKEWDTAELITQYREWLRDHWNHPSVAIWDASNETIADVFAEKIIPAVRPLDLSNRPWENGYNLPADPEDPIEDHPYLFSSLQSGRAPAFRMADLERMTAAKSTNSAHPSAHAVILNEYGWLWLNRDGEPTELTRNVYRELLGPDSTAEQRFELNAYLLAGLTEFWRAHRNFAGVLHFVYLTSSYPGAFTSDHFRDVERLELEPHFADFVREAFKPLGVYINFWQPEVQPGDRRFSVMMINDKHEPAAGTLALTLGSQGRELARVETAFAVPALGQQTYALDLRVPAVSGTALLKAIATPNDNRDPTVGRRHVSISSGTR